MLTAIAVVTLGLAAQAPPESPGEALVRARLESDMGKHEDAAATFARVAETETATAAQRREALARLGAERRQMGDASGAAAAFERAWEARVDDPDERRLLLRATGSPLPGPERWREVWSQVRLAFDGPPGTRRLRTVWPGIPDAPCPQEGVPVDLDIDGADLGDLFRLFADVSGDNVVVAPWVHGTVDIAYDDVPWDAALCGLLAPHGYVMRRVGNVTWIGRPEEAPAPRSYRGAPIDIELHDEELVAALEKVARAGGCRVKAEGVSGHTTLKLVQVRWDQAFDLIATLNGVRWERHGDLFDVSPR